MKRNTLSRGEFVSICYIIGLSLGWFAGSMLCGCRGATKAIGSFVGADDSVYVCNVGVELELCWNGTESQLAIDLEAQYGLTDVPCMPSPRPATWFGCFYGCEPHQGCNAKDGCFCPPP